MGWINLLKNLEVGKMEIIPPGKRVDNDDPMYEQEVHVVPCREEDIIDAWQFNLGVHDCTRDCCCRPTVREQTFGRTLVIHKNRAN
jgi:hypothetical protein